MSARPSGPRVSRRVVLRWAAGTAAAVVLPATGLVGWVYATAGSGNAGLLPLNRRLRIPPVLEPAAAAGGRRRFDLRLEAGTSELLPGRQTPTWGANGTYLGPTVRARRGDEVALAVHNDLPEETTLHWHGMHLPAVADGGPHQPIAPGEVWTPSWCVDQPAATLWYHPHLHTRTAPHVYRGVAGMFLVDDPSTDGGLPREYGVDDIPLIIQDKKFHGDGSLDERGMEFGGTRITGLLGDTILVNGTYSPYLEVARSLTRFRLLNASNARVYDVGFADDRAFWLVGTDGGLLTGPREVRSVPLSPGERAEVVVAFTPGDDVVLQSRPPRLGANLLYERLAGGDDTFDLVRIVTADQLEASPPLPDRLPGAPSATLEAGGDAGPRVRTFAMGDFTLNGETMDMRRVDEVVPAGAVEIWEVTGGRGLANGIPHNFHVHGVTFDVVERDGRAAPPELRGPKDTVYVPPESTVRLAIRFPRYSDPAHPYMFHCHVLAHEDAGMMGQFVVVDGADRDRVDVPAAAARWSCDVPGVVTV